MIKVIATLVAICLASRAYAEDATANLMRTPIADQQEIAIPLMAISEPSLHSESINVLSVELTPLILEELGFVEEYAPQSRAVELLGQQFSRAVAQGLVEVNSSSTPFVRGPALGTLDERANISTSTGLDRDTGTSSAIKPTPVGTVCLSDWDVDITAWGDPNDGTVLGKLRTAAAAEDGSILPAGAADLSRYYLALGFGTEALALSEYVTNPKEKAVIQALAEVLDEGKSNSQTLYGQIYCEGSVAMWAALASPIPADHLQKNTNVILSTFSGLPVHLRSHLGPILSERLREAGLDAEARNALNSVTRSGSNTDESKLMTARLGLTGTSSDNSRAELEALSHGTDVNAAEALLELLEDAEKRVEAPKIAWVEEVPSLVRATEGTEVAIKLNLAGFRALITIEKFDLFRSRIEEDTQGLTPEKRQELSASALAAANTVASNEIFLRTELGLARLVPPEALQRRDRYALGKRLSNIGLSERAERYLPAMPTTVYEFQIAAQILTAIGNRSEAVALLDTANNDALMSDLGDILSDGGQLDRAISTFAKSGHPEFATGAALRRGDWDWVASNGVSEISESARVVSSGRNPIIEGSSIGNAPLLVSAQERRIQAKKLLQLLESIENSPLFTN